MSKRLEVERRIEALGEIHGIMGSMKNLALMEARKLTRFYEMQQRAADSIGAALNDVRRHYASAAPAPEAPPVYLLFGSERGFCGGYNQQLLETLARQPACREAPLIAVGARLAGPLERDYPHAVRLPGAAVADEVEGVLADVAGALDRLRREQGPLGLEVIYFQPGGRGPGCRQVLPPLESVPGPGLAPLINLPSRQLLGELLEHYVFALIHACYFAALTTENQHRVQHLEQAGRHLERQADDLGRRRNVLRQEEIIEEIEVILLSSGSAPPDNPGKRDLSTPKRRPPGNFPSSDRST